MKTDTSKTATAEKADATVVPLQQFYLSMLCAVLNADKLDVLQQDLPTTQDGTTGGRLYATSKGTSSPLFVLTYAFERDAVKITVEGRQERSLPAASILYSVGLDDYLGKLHAFLRQGRLAAPRAA